MGNPTMILAVAAGGAIGSVLRYLTGKGIMHFMNPAFPYATLFVNIAGSFIMGILVAMFATQVNPSMEMRAFLTVGILGGYTTFSAFSLDAVTLWERGDIAPAIVYILVSVILSICALFAGMLLVRGVSI